MERINGDAVYWGISQHGSKSAENSLLFPGISLGSKGKNEILEDPGPRKGSSTFTNASQPDFTLHIVMMSFVLLN